MYIGQRLLVKHLGQLLQGNVEKITGEELYIKLDNNELIIRKFWEVRKLKDTIYEKN